MKYGLSDSTIGQIQNVLRSIPAIDRAIIYGSRARGDNSNGSDVDLTLDGETLSRNDLYRLYNQLDDLLIPYHFDLSIRREIHNPALLCNIDRDGKVFYNAISK